MKKYDQKGWLDGLYLIRWTVNNADEENKPCRDPVACPRPMSAKEKQSWNSNSGLLTPTFSRDESILSLLCLGQGHLKCPILFHASRSTCVISIENSHWPLRGSKTCVSDAHNYCSTPLHPFRRSTLFCLKRWQFLELRHVANLNADT